MQIHYMPMLGFPQINYTIIEDNKALRGVRFTKGISIHKTILQIIELKQFGNVMILNTVFVTPSGQQICRKCTTNASGIDY